MRRFNIHLMVAVAVASLASDVTAGSKTSGYSTKFSKGANPNSWNYGYWGGANNSNGALRGNTTGNAPIVDAMDAIFRTHDTDLAKVESRWRTQYELSKKNYAAAKTLKDRVTAKRDVNKYYARMAAEYSAANAKCVASLAGLGKAHPLKIYANGTDSWGGKSQDFPKGITAAWRDSFRKSAQLVIVNFPRK
jgi:hypothetical protein